MNCCTNSESHLTTSSLQPSSIPTYTRAWKLFRQFYSTLFQTACFSLPIMPATMALFIAYLFECHYATSMVNTYISVLSCSHKLSGLPDPTRVFFIIQMLKGYGKNRARLDSRLPITLSILQRLIEVSPRLTSSHYQRCQFKAIVLFGIICIPENWRDNDNKAYKLPAVWFRPRPLYRA